MVVDSDPPIIPSSIGADGLRRFVPTVGRYYKLQLMEDYFKHKISPWINGLVVELRESDALMSFGVSGNRWIPFSTLDPPIGWKPYYDVSLADTELEKFKKWESDKGVAIWASHLIGDGTVSYLPLTDEPPSSPGWRYPVLTDVVPTELCSITFRLFRLERMMDVSISAPCEYCNGSGTRIATKHHIPHLAAAVGESFPCFTCDQGIASRSLASVDKKKREAEKKRLKSEGWELEYVSGSDPFWRAVRSTLVRDLALIPTGRKTR